MPPEMSAIAGATSGASSSSPSISDKPSRKTAAKNLKFKKNKLSKHRQQNHNSDFVDDQNEPLFFSKDSVCLVTSSPPSSSSFSSHSKSSSHASTFSKEELTFSPSTCSLCSATLYSTSSLTNSTSKTPKSFHYSCSASSSFSSTCSSLSSNSSSCRRTSDSSFEKPSKESSKSSGKKSHHRSHSHSSAVSVLQLRPTLQCIRNTLSLADSTNKMKRYDRLSSSKSDLHLNSTSSTSGHQPLTSTTSSGGLNGGEVEVIEDKLGKSHIGHSRLASSSEIILVETVNPSNSNRKSTIHLESTYSSTENIIPPSSGGDLGAEEDHIPEEEILENPSPWETPISTSANISTGTPLVQLPSTNTFRSFIKTKTSSGIGIMRGKDHHHHHGSKALEEDEEALQLCDSESTVSSVIGTGDLISSTTLTGVSPSNVIPILLPPPPPPQPSSACSSSSVLVSSTKSSHLYNHQQFLHHNQTPLSSTSSVPLTTYHHHNHHQAIFLANPCHSTTSTTSCGGCSISSSTSQIAPSSAQTTLTSIDSVTSYSNNSSSQKRESNGNGKHYHLHSTASSPFPANSTSQPSPNVPTKQSRHRTFIPPILKPTRFVKNVTNHHNNSHHGSKGNLLFNVKSHGHKSKSSKQRSAEGGKDHHLQRMNSELAVESLKSDRLVVTQPEEDRRRRTIIIEKANNSFGFTLQTYGIKHCREGEVELITYVDEVAYGGPAFRGGMRPGDVILSINGRDVEKADHRTLVGYIGTCEKTMRLVVLFEDCVRKIELNIKYIKLKKALQTKLAQLEILNQRENQILLNAALRTRSAAEDAENWENNNNNLCTSNTSSAKLKKYKCKSLDVSLDDLNANLVVENSSTIVEPWPGTIAVEASTGKGVQTPLDSEEEEEEFDEDENENTFAADKDEEKRTLHSRGGKKKSNGGGNGNSNSTNSGGGTPRIGSAGTVLSVINSENLGMTSSTSSRSKSLPQSVTNSMDCLTNEAYEDDEDLIGTGGGNQKKVISGGGGLRLSSTTATHDKDFITKL